MDIVSRNARILDRRTPAEERSAIALEAFKKQFGPFTRYIITALKPISRKYTDKLIEQGDRVENQLKERLKHEYPDLQFRFTVQTARFGFQQYSHKILKRC